MRRYKCILVDGRLFAAGLFCMLHFLSMAQLLPVKDNEKCLYGYKNDGDEAWAIKPAYTLAFPFHGQYAVVLYGDKYGAIDENGKFFLKPVYDELNTRNSHEQNAWWEDSYFVFSKKGRGGIIDENGKLLIEGDFSVRSDDEGYPGTFSLWKSPPGLNGYFDTAGHFIAPVSHDGLNFNPQSADSVVPFRDSAWRNGYITISGRILALSKTDGDLGHGDAAFYYRKNSKFDVFGWNAQPLFTQLDSVIAITDVSIVYINHGKYAMAWINDSAKYKASPDNSTVANPAGFSGNMIPEGKYQIIGAFYGGIAPVQRNGLWGLIDKYGKELTAPAYDSLVKFYSASGWRSDVAAVVVKKNNLYGVLNKLGQVILKPQFSDIDFREDRDDGSVFFVVSNKRLQCYKVLTGEPVPLSSLCGEGCKAFSFVMHNQQSVADTFGNIYQLPACDTVIAGSHVMVLRNRGLYGAFSLNTMKVIQPIYAGYCLSGDWTPRREDGGHEGDDNYIYFTTQGGKITVADADGNIILDSTYKRVTFFDNDAQVFWVEKPDGKWYTADEVGKVSETGYDAPAAFVYGKTFARTGGKKWMITLTGTPLVNCDSLIDEVPETQFNLFWIENQHGWGLMNCDGVIILQPRFDSYLPFSDNYAFVRNQGHWGMVDTTGHLALGFSKLKEAYQEDVPDTTVDVDDTTLRRIGITYDSPQPEGRESNMVCAVLITAGHYPGTALAANNAELTTCMKYVDSASIAMPDTILPVAGVDPGKFVMLFMGTRYNVTPYNILKHTFTIDVEMIQGAGRGYHNFDDKTTNYFVDGDSVKAVSLGDCFNDKVDYQSVLSHLCMAQIKKMGVAIDCSNPDNLANGSNFSIGSQGLQFQFHDNSQDEGRDTDWFHQFIVTIPYSSLAQYVNKQGPLKSFYKTPAK